MANRQQKISPWQILVGSGLAFGAVVASIATVPVWIGPLLVAALFVQFLFLAGRKSDHQGIVQELEVELQSLKDQLENLKLGEYDPSNAVIEKTIESKYVKIHAELDSNLKEVQEELNSERSIRKNLQEKYQKSREDILRLNEQLSDLRADRESLACLPSDRLKVMEHRSSNLENLVGERDEQLSVQQSLLRRILDLVPVIQRQLNSVIENTENSAIEIGDKVRYIYEKAQEHLVESNEISKQFSGQSLSDESRDSNHSISSVLSSSLQLLKDMTDMLDENSRLNVDYSKSIEAILENTATINKITEDIQYISDQTNLLALNAAIEAARAGEHGRGFSVVAEEVRKLSDRTNQASNDITQIVSKVNDSVQAISNSLIENLRKTKSKKESVDVAVESLMFTAKDSTEVFSKLVEGSVVSSESVAHNIDQIILSLQFQDITRQEIEAAFLPLTQIGSLADEMVTKLKSVKAEIEDKNDEGSERPSKLRPIKTAKEPPKEGDKEASAVKKVAEAVSEDPTDEALVDRATQGDVLFF
jgi:methyl-accepting chemotaxis protein